MYAPPENIIKTAVFGLYISRDAVSMVTAENLLRTEIQELLAIRRGSSV